ncbi:TonB-dependent receptor domain-containing protein, partial [Klebsiella pneumoniae]
FENIQQGYVVEPNSDLKPESSKSFETGLRGNFESGNFDVAVFYNKYHDFINEDAAVLSPTGPAFKASNIKRATIKGVEAKGRLNLD